MIKFSIVIPCYNEEKNLSKLLISYTKFKKINENTEIIFVDNGSSDSSYEIMKRYKKKK